MIERFIEDAIHNLLFGWTGWVPMEAWIGIGVIIALIVLRFLGWSGLVALAAGVGYWLGFKRGREKAQDGRKPPDPTPTSPKPQTPVSGPRRRTLVDLWKEWRR